jgi:hypothetical protein
LKKNIYDGHTTIFYMKFAQIERVQRICNFLYVFLRHGGEIWLPRGDWLSVIFREDVVFTMGIGAYNIARREQYSTSIGTLLYTKQ